MDNNAWLKTNFTDTKVLVLWNLASGNISVGKACDVLNGGDTEMPMNAEQASDYYGGDPVRIKGRICNTCGTPMGCEC